MEKRNLSSSLKRKNKGRIARPDWDILSDQILQYVASRLGKEWENLALSLQCEINEVEQFKEDNKYMKDQCIKMLIAWRRRRGQEEGLIEELVNALIENGRKDVADNLLDKIQDHTFMSDREQTKDNKDPTGDVPIDSGLERQSSSEYYDMEEILEMGDEHFIETDVYNKAEQILINTKEVIIKGQNGSGKTSLAYHLFNKIADLPMVEEKMYCLKLDDITEHFEVEKTKVFFLDDVFGTLNVNKNAISEWSQLMQELSIKRREQEETGCETFLIFCCRSDILGNVEIDFPPESILDVSLFLRELHQSKKREIFEKIWRRHNAKDEFPTYIKEFNFPENEHLGFWFCVDFHARLYHEHGTAFWEDPLKILLTEIKNYIDKHTIPRHVCETLSCWESDMSKKNAQASSGLIASDVDVLRHFPQFFKFTKEECYEFRHKLLHDEIELHLATKDMPKAIKYLRIRSLSKVTVDLKKKGKCRSTKVKLNQVCLRDERDVCQLLKRIVDFVKEGHAHEVCKHMLWNSNDPHTVTLFDEHVLKKTSPDLIQVVLAKEDETEGHNILYWSARENKTDLCKLLINYIHHHEDLKSKTHIFSNALIGACAVRKNVSIVKELIKHCANVSYCHGCHFENHASDSPSFQTANVKHIDPLSVAIKQGNINHAECLLKNGAVIQHSSWPQWDVLHEAANLSDPLMKNTDFMNGLVRIFTQSQNQQCKNPQTTGKYDQFFTEIKDCGGDIDLIFLAFAKFGFLSSNLLQVFTKCKANVNCLELNSKKNALHLLIESEDGDIDEKCRVIQDLLKAGTDGVHKSKDVRETPLSLTIKRRTYRYKIAEVLLSAGVNPNSTSYAGKTPLHLCVEEEMETKEAISLITLFKKYKCDLSITDKDGYTAVERILSKDIPNIDLIRTLSSHPIHACIECDKLSEEIKCKVIEYLSSQVVNINEADKLTNTALSKAIKIGCSEQLIELLLRLKADCSSLYENDKSILQILFSTGHLLTGTVIEEFIKYDYWLCKGNAAIIVDLLKCQFNCYTLVKKIVTVHSEKTFDFSSIVDSEKRTLLHLCVISFLEDEECLELCEFFIEHGASPEHVDKYEDSFLSLAVKNDKMLRRKTIVRIIKEKICVSKNFKGNIFLQNLFQSGQLCVDVVKMAKPMINKTKTYKTKLLHKIAESDSRKFCWPMMPNTPQPISEDKDNTVGTDDSNLSRDSAVNQDSRTYCEEVDHKKLENDSEHNDQECASKEIGWMDQYMLVKTLCECGLEINNKNDHMQTPLFLACCCEIPDTNLIIAFCENSADVNAKDDEDSTPLHACMSSAMDDKAALEVSKILVKYGAKVNKLDLNGRSPLLVATEQIKDRSLCVTYLVQERKANIDCRDRTGNGCLHNCINRKVSDYEACSLLELLLEFNAAIDCKTKSLLTPLNMAATNRNHSRILCMLYLLAKGAQVNSVDFYQRTPLNNVLRGFSSDYNATTSLERIVRVALLFAFGADPTCQKLDNQKAGKNENSGDAVISLIESYPYISIDQLDECIKFELDRVGQTGIQTAAVESPFVFNAGDQKRKLYEKVLKASTFLTNVCFIPELVCVDDNVKVSERSSAQVAVKTGKKTI